MILTLLKWLEQATERAFLSYFAGLEKRVAAIRLNHLYKEHRVILSARHGS
ncbi:MAG: hypothetical protein K2X27_11865 [Candidatus Obscuribacterales bacterium]|nr:hypothetical protein [Candidatus Obscuribacterales bacterium]